jgi:hypothetical protein
VIVKGANRQLAVGVKLEQSETDRHAASAAFIDSDEIDEFLGALDFIVKTAGHVAHDRRDYTEVTYSSKDNVTIGFYQDGLKQQAFVRLAVGVGIRRAGFPRRDAIRHCRRTGSCGRSKGREGVAVSKK